jgi:hypothetical protein
MTSALSFAALALTEAWEAAFYDRLTAEEAEGLVEAGWSAPDAKVLKDLSALQWADAVEPLADWERELLTDSPVWWVKKWVLHYGLSRAETLGWVAISMMVPRPERNDINAMIVSVDRQPQTLATVNGVEVPCGVLALQFQQWCMLPGAVGPMAYGAGLSAEEAATGWRNGTIDVPGLRMLMMLRGYRFPEVLNDCLRQDAPETAIAGV